MAIQGTLTLNEISLLEVDADPRVTATPADIGSLAILDSTGQIFRKFNTGDTDWRIASFLDTYEATANANITTTSTTDVLVTSMTVTPARGKYLAFFNCVQNSSSATATTTFSIYAGGTQITSSETFNIRDSSTGRPPICIAGVPVEVNGSQAVEARWRTSTGTATMYGRRTLRLATAG